MLEFLDAYNKTKKQKQTEIQNRAPVHESEPKRLSISIMTSFSWLMGFQQNGEKQMNERYIP